MKSRAALLAMALMLAAAGSAAGQPADSSTSAKPVPAAATPAPRDPFVRGGYDDKPYVDGVFGRVRVGGYAEANGAWEREDGATDALGFELRRLNLLTSTVLRERIEVWTEIEFEEGGKEIALELAQIDVRFHPAANLRGGMLLLPLGRFNLAHDAPRSELPRRPLLATDLIGSALSQPGLGLFGRFDTDAGRFTYEGYGVTGYDARILEESPDGTRLPLGKANSEDANASPAWVGRAEWRRGGRAPHASRFSAALSGYHGAYNRYRVNGLDIDARRNVSIGVADLEAGIAGFRLAAEGALVRVDVPDGLLTLFASRQSGGFLELSRPIARAMPRSWPGASLSAVVRAEAVDFDRELPGDSRRAITLGLNLRPIPETCLKLAFTRGESRDRFNNLGTNAALVFGLATYF